MIAQVVGSHIKSVSRPRPASGAHLKALVDRFRRKGYTASFGVDKDPKVVQK